MGKRKNPQQQRQQQQQQPRPVEHISDDDSEDEEIDEEEAFNSEDERKYGSFFRNESSRERSNSDSDDDDDGSESDDESDDDDDDDDGLASDDDDSAEGDGGQYMLDLLDKIDSSSSSNKGPSRNEPKSSSIAQHVKESQFSSSVITKANLTLDSLMDGLQDTKGFGTVQKSMKKVAQGQATAAPVARVVSDRARRKVHYADQSKQVSQWLETVQQNRQAETLDFRPKQRMELTRDVLVQKFTPTTDFEKQLHAALQEAGQQDEQALLDAEEAALQDDLGANQVTLEEYKKRRGQLAKMRALMFYQEQKRHHINKIKSKKYRRIRKKQRERLKESETEALLEENPDLERELQEKEEMERMKERMTLAHKNTSKWAKRILKRGKNVDVDTRKALSAQLKRGDDLLKRMKTSGEEEDDSDEDLVETAKKVLADTETPDDEAVQRQGLFKLSFMRRGIERQREQARQEARQLLLELEENEEIENGNDGGDSNDSGDGDDEHAEQKRRKTKKSASKEEMKHVLKDGEMVASSLKFGASNTTQVSGGISIDMGPSSVPSEDSENKKTTTSEYSSTMEATPTASVSDKPPIESSSKKTATKSKTKKAQAAPTTVNQKVDSNPWMIHENDNDKVAASPATAKMVTTSKRGHKNKSNVDIDRAIDLLSSNDPHAAQDIKITKDNKSNGDKNDDKNDDKTASKSATDVDSKAKKVVTLTQEELVARAFAGPTAEQAQEEFDREKNQVADREDPNRRKRRQQEQDDDAKANLGWGCWTGQGAPPPKRQSRKLPRKLRAPTTKKKKLGERQRQDQGKPNVILSERRVKRLADQFMVAEIPHPYTSREEYERAMAGGVGREWNVTSSFQDMTRPEVMTRMGKIIQPLSKKVKRQHHHRPAAKF